MSRASRILAKVIRKTLGIKLSVEGELSYLNETGNFVVANHTTYLDGIILASLFAVIFVTKLQVKSWPLFGWMARAGGTIFIDRKKRMGALDFIREISNTLNEKTNVLFFPEGTSGNASRMLPFNHAYFQAPINCGACVIPVTINYTSINSQAISTQNKDLVFWYGQVNFARHLWEALKQNKIEASLIIHPKINPPARDPSKASSRKNLSENSFNAISKDFRPIL